MALEATSAWEHTWDRVEEASLSQAQALKLWVVPPLNSNARVHKPSQLQAAETSGRIWAEELKLEALEVHRKRMHLVHFYQ